MKFDILWVELATQKKNFYKKLGVGNSRCDVLFVTRFRNMRIPNLGISYIA